MTALLGRTRSTTRLPATKLQLTTPTRTTLRPATPLPRADPFGPTGVVNINTTSDSILTTGAKPIIGSKLLPYISPANTGTA